MSKKIIGTIHRDFEGFFLRRSIGRDFDDDDDGGGGESNDGDMESLRSSMFTISNISVLPFE
jgi:hypothetical protein